MPEISKERQQIKESWIHRSTDAELRRQVWNHLKETEEDLDSSKIVVDARNSDILLKGTVNYRHEKYLAEKIASEVEGIARIFNEIEVLSPITKEHLEIHNIGWRQRMQQNTFLW